MQLDSNTVFSGMIAIVLAVFTWLKDRNHVSQLDDLRNQNHQLSIWLDDAMARLEDCESERNLS